MIQKIRTKVALLMALMMASFVVFSFASGEIIKNLDGQIDRIETQAVGGKKEYGDQTIFIQHSFIKTIEDNWDAQNEASKSLPLRERFDVFEPRLDIIMNQAWNSMVIAFIDENGEIYANYQNPDYGKWVNEIPVWEPMKHGELTIFQEEDADQPFGEGDRLFVSGTTLHTEDQEEVYVYVFFQEQIALRDMVETLNLDNIATIRGLLETLVVFMYAFWITVSCLGAAIVLYLKKLHLNTPYIKCPYIDSEMCEGRKKGTQSEKVVYYKTERSNKEG